MDYLKLAFSLLAIAGNLYVLVNPGEIRPKWLQGLAAVAIALFVHNTIHYVVNIRLEKLNKPVPAAVAKIQT